MARPIQGDQGDTFDRPPSTGAGSGPDGWGGGLGGGAYNPPPDNGGLPVVVQPLTAVYGKPLPIVWGTARVPGQLVYQSRSQAEGMTLYIPKSSGIGDYEEKTGDHAIVAIAICEGPVYRWGRIYRDRDVLSSGTELLQLTAKGTIFEIVSGTVGPVYPTAANGGGPGGDQGTVEIPWSSLVTDAAGMGFANTVYFRARNLALPDGSVPDLSFEIGGRGITYSEAGWDQDAPASLVMSDLLTEARFGAGVATSMVDVTGLDAVPWRVSRAVIERTKVISLIEELCDAVNSRAVWSPGVGKLRFVYLGDAVADATEIDDDEILRDRGQSDPVTVSQTAEASVFNVLPVTINSAQSNYQPATYDYKDEAHQREVPPGGTQPRGTIVGPGLSNGWVSQPWHAKALAQLKVQQSIYRRKTYTFRLGPRWMLLEPMDVIAFTHAALGLSNETIRIETIEDDERGIRTVTAVEWPEGAATVNHLVTQTHDGYSTKTPGRASSAELRSDLADIASDNVLSPGEKPIVIRDYNVIIAEYQALHDQAISFGFTPGTYTGDGTDGGGEAGVLDAEMDIELGG